MTELEDRIIESFKTTPIERAPVNIVDSDFMFDFLKKYVSSNDFQSRYEVYTKNVIEYDLTSEQPMKNVIDGMLINPDSFDKDFMDELQEKPDEFREGRHLTSVLREFENLKFENYIFFTNPQHMSVKAARKIKYLAMATTNASDLNSTYIFIPGGDFWDKPQFAKEVLPDGTKGADLNYIRRMRLREVGNFNDIKFTHPKKGEDFMMNIYGPHYSGKSRLMNSIRLRMDLFGNRMNYISVYKDMDLDGFKSEFESRDMDSVYIDDIDRLPPEAITFAQERMTKMICTSQEKLPGFSQYVNTDK